MPNDAPIWWAVTIDSTDPQRLAEFWSALFDRPIIELGSDREGWLRVQPNAASGPVINFQPVPEMVPGKPRLHLDVFVNDLAASVARVIELGGTDSGVRETLPRGRIAVMRDPDTNEFCLLASPAP